MTLNDVLAVIGGGKSEDSGRGWRKHPGLILVCFAVSYEVDEHDEDRLRNRAGPETTASTFE